MNENQVFLYNNQNYSPKTNKKGEFSFDEEIKYKDINHLEKELTKIKEVRQNSKNDLDNIDDKNYNYLKTQSKNENLNKEDKNFNINKYQNILNKKNKNLNKNRKNRLFSNFDSVNENLIYENTSKAKDLSQKYDFNKSDRRLKEEDEKINDNQSKELTKFSNEELLEQLYDKIIGYNIELKILYDDLYSFFFNSIPKNKTLSTNINIRNDIIKDKIKKSPDKIISEKIEKIKTYDFDLEILRNHQIYFFGKIISNFPCIVVKIYISDNFYKHSEITPKNIFESNFYLVGIIESNLLRTEFNIFKGNKNDNCSKIMSINYTFNILGLFGTREMIVNKYDNNKLLYSLKNQIPRWDNEFKVYKLNFNGRVKLTCKKNFILHKENENILQCGKINDNSFALDFIHPLTPFESFCIAITSLIDKKTCE